MRARVLTWQHPIVEVPSARSQSRRGISLTWNRRVAASYIPLPSTLSYLFFVFVACVSSLSLPTQAPPCSVCTLSRQRGFVNTSTAKDLRTTEGDERTPVHVIICAVCCANCWHASLQVPHVISCRKCLRENAFSRELVATFCGISDVRPPLNADVAREVLKCRGYVRQECLRCGALCLWS